MSLKKWSDSKIKKMNCADIQLIKLSSMAFILMVARLWEPLLSLEWYWYALVFVLAALKPIIKVIRK